MCNGKYGHNVDKDQLLLTKACVGYLCRNVDFLSIEREVNGNAWQVERETRSKVSRDFKNVSE